MAEMTPEFEDLELESRENNSDTDTISEPLEAECYSGKDSLDHDPALRDQPEEMNQPRYNLDLEYFPQTRRRNQTIRASR